MFLFLLSFVQDAIQAQMVIQKMSELVTGDTSGGDGELTSISEAPNSEGGGSMTTDDIEDEADDDVSPMPEEEEEQRRQHATATTSIDDETNANLEFKSNLDSENNVPVSRLVRCARSSTL